MTNKDLVFDDKIAVIADYVGRDFMKLARELRDLKDQKPDIFISVAQKAGIGNRRAFALARIARLFSDLGVPDVRLNRIGWTKLNRISSHLDEINAFHLLALAEEHTSHQLDAILRGEQPVEDARVLQLYLAPADYERLKAVLKKHGAVPSGNGMIKVEAALLALVAKVEAAA